MKLCKVDKVFLFILKKSDGDVTRKIGLTSISNEFGFTRKAIISYIQVLYGYGSIKKSKEFGKTEYYSFYSKKEYFDFVNSKRIRKCTEKSKLNKSIDDFIYSGCPERIGENLNIFV